MTEKVKSPAVSLANLIEYMSTSKAGRRSAIIEQYHLPQSVKMNWHGKNPALFQAALANPSQALTALLMEKKRLKAQIAERDQVGRRAKVALELLELIETSDLSRLVNGLQLCDAATLPNSFQIDELSVIVRPGFLLSEQRPGFRHPHQGILVCHMSKGFNLTTETGQLYAVALQMLLESTDSETELVSPELCRVYDLVTDTMFMAPQNQKRRRQELRAAAQEICDRWYSIGGRVSLKTSKAKPKTVR